MSTLSNSIDRPLSSLDEQVYRDVRDMIINGILKPGDQIVQEALSQRLGVSRTPLRKAIATLVQENFLEVTARGTFVRSFKPEELISIWNIRAVLEGLVCRLVAERGRPEEIDYLRFMITSAAKRSTPDDWTSYVEADREFHSQLARYARDPLLVRILDTYHILSIALARALRPPEETLPEHLEILEALDARDADLAEKRMLEHIRSAIQQLIKRQSDQTSPDSLPARFTEVVEEAVAALVSDLGETTLVAVEKDLEASIVHMVEAKHALRVSPSPTEPFPLHATASGKVLLSRKAKNDLISYVKSARLNSFTEATITEPDALFHEIADVGKRDLAIDREEFQVGVTGIAAPIRSNGSVVAAISILVPTPRLSGSATLDMLNKKLLKAAKEISVQF